jgi:hypothetical protein
MAALTPGKAALKFAAMYEAHTGEDPIQYTNGNRDRFVKLQSGVIRHAMDVLGIAPSELDDYLSWYFAKKFLADGEPWTAGRVLSKKNVEAFRNFQSAHEHETLETAVNRPTDRQLTPEAKELLMQRGRWTRGSI